MKAPDTSLNYNAAQSTHQEDTGTWFIRCSEFVTWKQQGSVLWLHGKREYSGIKLEHASDADTLAGSGKTILW